MEIPHSLLEGLNPQQVEGVSYRGPTLLISAGAGTGKTKVLTHRLAGFLATGEACSDQILAITFTNKAAAEMRYRTAKLVGPSTGYMQISTFHSACARILRECVSYTDRSGNFTIYDAADQKAIITQICRPLNTFGLTPGTIAAQISLLKNQMHNPESYSRQIASGAGGSTGRSISQREELILNAFRVYTDILKNANAFDFDDLISETVLLFQRHREVADAHKSRWKYLLVDEYQDTNRAQYRLILELAKDARFDTSLTVVGDPDQSIYAFRGADIANIVNFESDFPGCHVISLEQNYRSSQNILLAANALIAHNQRRKDKNLWSELGAGEKIIAYYANSPEEEGRFVASRISHLIDQGESLADIAVFYRSNTQSKAIEEALIRQSVPYRVLGGTKFYERAEIKDILAYLTVIVNPDDTLALRRILNVPKRGVGAVSENKLVEFAETHGITLRQALARVREINMHSVAAPALQNLSDLLDRLSEPVPVNELLDDLLNSTGLLSRFENSDDPQNEARKINVRDFIDSVEDFSKEHPGATVYDFMTEIALMTNPNELDEILGQVTLMTLHMAKGLEFNFVFLTGMEEGVLPHEMSFQEPGGIEEERRLAYVGMTRAKKILHLSAASYRRQYTQNRNPQAASRFLDEVPQNLLQWHSRSTHKRFTGALRGFTAHPRGPRLNLYSGQRSGFAPGSGSDATSGSTLGSERQSVLSPAQKLALRTAGRVIPTFSVSDRVEHSAFGVGTVIDVLGTPPKQIIVVDFGDKRRTLLASAAPLSKCKK